MEPIILIIDRDITTRAYEVEPGIWLKATAGPDFCEYSWYIGETWGESRQGSPAPKTPQYARYGPDGFKFVWIELGHGLHRDNAPAVITRAGDIITAEWYQRGKRAPAPSSGPLMLYYDPFGNEITSADMEKYARVVIAPPARVIIALEKAEDYLDNVSHNETSSDSESSDFTDATIDIAGTMTFGKLAELVLAKYLLLSSEDYACKAAQEMLRFYYEIRCIARKICASEFVPLGKIHTQDFRTIYNIYVAKLAAGVLLEDSDSSISAAINTRAAILKKFKEFGVADRDTFIGG